MVEMLGVLLAGLLAGLAWLLWRLGRALRALLLRDGLPRAPLRAAPLRLARRRLRRADARAAAQAAEIQRLRLTLRLLEHQCAMPVAQGTDRFQQAKHAFALRFHPDRVAARGLERAVRIAMLKEHWAELRRIERG